MSLMSGSGCAWSLPTLIWGTDIAGQPQCPANPLSSPVMPHSPSPALQSQRPFPSPVKTVEGPSGTEVTWTPGVKIKFLPRIPKCPEPKKYRQPCGSKLALQPSCEYIDLWVRKSPRKTSSHPSTLCSRLYTPTASSPLQRECPPSYCLSSRSDLWGQAFAARTPTLPTVLRGPTPRAVMGAPHILALRNSDEADSERKKGVTPVPQVPVSEGPCHRAGFPPCHIVRKNHYAHGPCLLVSG